MYDARVRALRTWLAEGREDELRAGLAEARALRLWRARNVTNYRAFAESVVGLSPTQAEALVPSEAQLAAEAPDHVIALAIRVEAALLAHAKDAKVMVRAHEAGGLHVAFDFPAADTARAIDAIDAAGRAVDGLRRFLRDADRTELDRDSHRARDDRSSHGASAEHPRRHREDASTMPHAGRDTGRDKDESSTHRAPRGRYPNRTDAQTGPHPSDPRGPKRHHKARGDAGPRPPAGPPKRRRD